MSDSSPIPSAAVHSKAATGASPAQPGATIQTADIAKEWRELVAPGYSWRPTPNQAGVLGRPVGGEAGGLFVECDRLGGRRAYMKPLKVDPDPKFARAAREKIASDLAHDLDVPVPPVVLRTREAPCRDERHVAISLVMYPAQWPWSEVKPLVYDAGEVGALIRSALPIAAARGLAFDFWVDQRDHDDHPHNIVLGYIPNQHETNRSLIFLDFAFSLGIGGRWENSGFQSPDLVPHPRLLVEMADLTALDEIVTRIENFDEATVRDIVTRVPESHLAADQKQVIIDGLLHRRALVRQAMALQTRSRRQ